MFCLWRSFDGVNFRLPGNWGVPATRVANFKNVTLNWAIIFKFGLETRVIGKQMDHSSILGLANFTFAYGNSCILKYFKIDGNSNIAKYEMYCMLFEPECKSCAIWIVAKYEIDGQERGKKKKQHAEFTPPASSSIFYLQDIGYPIESMIFLWIL